jgi:hypothetical protein
VPGQLGHPILTKFERAAGPFYFWQDYWRMNSRNLKHAGGPALIESHGSPTFERDAPDFELSEAALVYLPEMVRR